MNRLQKNSTSFFRWMFLMFAAVGLFSSCIGIVVGSSMYYQGSFWLPLFYTIFFFGFGLWYYKRFAEHKNGFWIGFVLCLVLRFIAVTALQLEPFSDFEIYQNGAVILTSGQPIHTNYGSVFPHTIGFSALLSGFYKMVGVNLFAVQIGNVLLEAATAVMIYLCAKKLFSQKIANFSLLLYAISPSFILYSEFVCTEIIFTFLLTLLFYLAIRCKEKGSVLVGSIFGILTAVLHCIRPCGIVIILAFSLYLIFCCVPKKRFLALALALICYVGGNKFFYLGMEALNGQPIAKAPFGYNLFIGANAKEMGRWNQADAEYAYAIMDDPTVSPDEFHTRLKNEGIQRFIDNGFIENVKLMFLKFGLLWGSQILPAFYLQQTDDFASIDPYFQIGNLSDAFHLVMMFGVLIGAAKLRRKKEQGSILFVCIFVLGVSAQHLLAETQERYAYGALVLLLPVAAIGLLCAFDAVRNVFTRLKEDINAVMEKDPAAKNKLEVFLLSPGIHALFWHRAAHRLYLKKRYFLARSLSQFVRLCTGIEIHPGAKIGRGVMIDHGMGVVIGETAEVGDGCTIYQNVTLGGTGKDTGKRHPTIGKNVMIGSGAKVLGPFTVGDNSKIAANAVVLREVPENSTCVGVPARVVIRNNVKVSGADWQTDQTHIPDPLSQELCRMLARIEKLEADSKKPEADSKKLEADSKKPEADSKKLEADSKKPEADSKKPEADSKKLEADIKESESVKGEE